MKTWGVVALVLTAAVTGALSRAAVAQTQASNPTVRGSWITERDGEQYMYIFALEGERLSGVVCAKCYDLDNLTFVADGSVEGDTLSFALVHDSSSGERYRETFSGKHADGQIALTVARDADRRPVDIVLKRPPPRVAEIFAEDTAARTRVAPESFVGPGPSEPLTPDNALGVWRSPVGSTAYLFKQVGDRIMGIACDSRCADGSYSAFIDSGKIARNTLLANIVHVDQKGEAFANLLTLYLTDGRMIGTYVDSRRPEKRVIHVMVRQTDPAAPTDAAWRGAF